MHEIHIPADLAVLFEAAADLFYARGSEEHERCYVALHAVVRAMPDPRPKPRAAV